MKGLATMDPIEQNIRNQLTNELVRMVRDHSADYTDVALEVAKDELRQRGVSPERIVAEQDDTDDRDGGGQGDRPAGNPGILSQLRSNTPDRNALLDLLLQNELEYVETYQAISDFVGSMSIRCGEYQGSVAVIKKMDYENFILFAEDIDENNLKKLLGCVAVGKSELTDRLDEIARKKGYAEVEQSPFEGYPF
jgi:hypothetical protein